MQPKARRIDKVVLSFIYGGVLRLFLKKIINIMIIIQLLSCHLKGFDSGPARQWR